jgi:hypothetical protein
LARLGGVPRGLNDLGDDMGAARAKDALGRIQPQPVEMELADPGGIDGGLRSPRQRKGTVVALTGLAVMGALALALGQANRRPRRHDLRTRR